MGRVGGANWRGSGKCRMMGEFVQRGKPSAAGQSQSEKLRRDRGGIGSGRRHGGPRADAGRGQSLHAGGRRLVRQHQAIATCSSGRTTRRIARAGTKEKPFGYFDATLVGGWQVPGEPYTNAPGTRLDVVARAHAGRPHQSLRPHLAAHGALRFQALQPRRQGLRLAHHLRRPGALLRQGRGTDRRLRHAARAWRTRPTASFCRRPRRAATSG